MRCTSEDTGRVRGVLLPAALLLAVTACGSAPSPTAVRPQPAQTAPAGVATSPTSSVTASTSALISRPDSTIDMVAIAPDGTAAVTVGETGDARLWPSLDGTREPRVLELPTSRAIAVAREPRGIAIAAVDGAGGLFLSLLDVTGATIEHASLAPDIAFTDVIATSHGFLAIRADQSLVYVASDGSLGAQLVAGTGEEIVAVAVANDQALVELDTDTGRGLRWLSLAPALAWGAWVHSKTPPEGVIALSPSGAQIAMLVGSAAKRAFVVLDAQTGAVKQSVRIAHSDVDDVGFVDELTLFIAGARAPRLERYMLDARPLAPVPPPQPSRRSRHRLASAAGLAVVGNDISLQIAGPRDESYLGYGVPDFPDVVSAGDHVLVPGARSLIELGADFTERTQYETSADIHAVEHVDGAQWLVETSVASPGLGNRGVIDLVDIAKKTHVAIWEGPLSAIAFEPHTRLLGITGARGILGRLDDTGALTVLSEMKSKGGLITVLPIDQTRANGVSALVITREGGVRVRWVTAPTNLSRGKTVQVLSGEPAAYDQLGHVYIATERGVGSSDLIAYKDGTQGAKIVDNVLGVKLFVSPDGARVVRTANDEIVVSDNSGKKLWSTPHAAFANIAWLADGSFVAASRSGISHYATDTGTRLAVRCGIAFGLHSTPPPAVSTVPSMCSSP